MPVSRTPKHALLAVLLCLLTFVINAAAETTSGAAITWYRGGKAKLTAGPIPATVASTVLLAGVTTQKTLLVKVAKNGREPRSTIIPLATDGSFSVRYLLKDGAGDYTITYFGSEQADALDYQGLGFVTLFATETFPANQSGLELNSRIIRFVDSVMGTPVGRGECWDLAQAALDANLADWSRPTRFGILLNADTDEIKAGDIMQFRALKLTEQLPGGAIRRGTLGTPDHTAIVYNVLGKKHYTLAHQNVAGTQIVMTTELNLAHVTSGEYWIYRPVAQMLSQ